MSTLLEELNKNKVIEDAVQPNKMSKFAYTEKAYNDNDAAGVDSFNFEAEQNIPSDKISVLQTNETVILKGFRAQASVVPRMLFDHFFGRASYNLNKVHDVVKGVLDAFVKFIGKANGLATLDENGRIPYSQLPESAMEFKGTWDASTNTPTLADGTGDTGDFYVVSVAGTQNLGSADIKFLENDRVIYSEGVWSKLSAGDVRTINAIQPTDGNITLTGDDINLSGSDTTKVSDKVTEHVEATTDVHGATTENTPNTIVLRNDTGKIQAVTPTENNDVANKEYVDNKTTGDAGAVQTALDEHIAKTTEVHGATSEAIANKIAIRDASGRLQVANPSAANDAVNKKSVISFINDLAITSWTAIADMAFGTTNITSVTYGNGKFVAVGYGGKGAYSTNGSKWTAISNMAFETNIITSVTYGNGKFVAVGYGGKGAYSTNGSTWTAIADMAFGTTPITSVTYGNGKFVAVGDKGKGAYSTNGSTWTAIDDMAFETNIITSVTYGNGKFVAVGDKGKGAYSTNGSTWTAIDDMHVNSFYTNKLYGVTYGNDRFVAVAEDARASYSTDGITWHAINTPSINNSAAIRAVAFGNNKFVIAGDLGQGSYCTDIMFWQNIPNIQFATYSINSIAYGTDRFVAVGQSGKGAYSLNLLT